VLNQRVAFRRPSNLPAPTLQAFRRVAAPASPGRSSGDIPEHWRNRLMPSLAADVAEELRKRLSVPVVNRHWNLTPVGRGSECRLATGPRFGSGDIPEHWPRRTPRRAVGHQRRRRFLSAGRHPDAFPRTSSSMRTTRSHVGAPTATATMSGTHRSANAKRPRPRRSYCTVASLR
jgi:hypothetical protein